MLKKVVVADRQAERVERQRAAIIDARAVEQLMRRWIARDGELKQRCWICIGVQALLTQRLAIETRRRSPEQSRRAPARP